jgi:hypothetical protein
MNRLATAIAALTLTSFALTACSSTEDRGAQVADLPTTAAGTSASANGAVGTPSKAADTKDRPRRRIDMTDAELRALYAPRDRCLKKQPIGSKDSGYEARMKAAYEACQRFEPLPPAQLDPANPQARAFIGLVVTCLQHQGIQARAVLPADVGEWIVKYSSGELAISSTRTEQSCMQQAAGTN